MDGFTLKQLRYFDAVVHHGHFGRAAAACAVSQPAISVQIKELEDLVGHRLFERHGRLLKLTSFGETFATSVRPILRSIDDLADLSRSYSEDLRGQLRLGVIPTIGPYMVPKVIGAISATYPDVELSIRETRTETLLAELRSGVIDVAILALPTSESDLTERELLTERFAVVTSRDHPLSDGFLMRDLQAFQLLLLEEGHCFRDQALSLCGGDALAASRYMDASSLATLVQMAAIGLGVTLIPEMAIPIEARAADVAIHYAEDGTPGRTIGLVWRKSSPLLPHLENLGDVLKRALELPAQASLKSAT